MKKTRTFRRFGFAGLNHPDYLRIAATVLIFGLLTVSETQAAPSENLVPISVKNGDFKNGSREWIPIDAQRGEVKGIEDDGACLQIKTTAGQYFLYNTTEIPLKHRSLVAKVQAKGKGLLYFYQLLYDSGKKYVNEGGVMSISPAFVTVGPEWEEYSFALSVPEGPAAMMKPYFFLAQAGSEIFLKDFQIFYNLRPDDSGKPTPTTYVPAPGKKTPPIFSGTILETGDPFYRIVLTKDGDPARSVTIEGGSGNGSYPEASVVPSVRTNGGDIFFEMEVAPKAGYSVFEAEYPILNFREISGPEYDRLIVPQNTGVVIANPLGAEKEGRGSPHHFGKGIWYGSYGTTYQSMQCLLYDNTETGVMLWTQDAFGNSKDFEVSKDSENKLKASIHHFPENTGATWKSPYPTVVSSYRGGWEVAAKKYRSWAIRQPWCANGGILERVRRSELPSWLAKNPFQLVAVNENNHDLLTKFGATFPDVEFSVFLTQWQHWPFDSGNPEYFPPKNEAGYKKLLQLQRGNIHFFPYMNMVALDHSFPRGTDFDKIKNSLAVPCPASLMSPASAESVPHYVHYQAFWGTDARKTPELKELLRKAWDGPVDEAILEKIKSDWMTVYQYEKEPLVRKIREAWGKNSSVVDQIRVKNEFKYFCRADKVWRTAFTELALRNLRDFGTDGQYLDESSVTGLFTCWATNHGHTPGFGSSYLKGTREFFSGIHNLAPRKVLMGEGLSEILIGAADEAHCQYPAFYNTNTPGLPLFQTVYHGYISHVAWDLRTPAFENLNDFAAAFSLMLHQGFKIGFAQIEAYIELLSAKQKNLALPLVREASGLLLAAMDTMVYGERLADPVVSGSPWHEVAYFPESSAAKTIKVARAAVEASAWRSLDGKKTTVLISNSCDKEIAVGLKSPDFGSAPSFKNLKTGEVFAGGASLPVKPFGIQIFEVL